MSILFNESDGVFFLNTPKSTYIIRVVDNKYLSHGGWVKRISSWSGQCVMPLYGRAFAPVPQELCGRIEYSLDVQPQEFPGYGHGDCRDSAVEVLSADGTTVTDLYYNGYRIYKGKKPLEGLPATFCKEDEAETLEIDLLDKVSGLAVTLSYTVWNKYDVICRSVSAKHTGSSLELYKGKPLVLRRLMSASLDFTGSRYRMIQLSGSWGHERHAIVRDLTSGIQKIQSRRNASSHQQNPFIALEEYDATEDSGTVYGFSFVYSGSFCAEVEVDQYNMSRVLMGLNPDTFEWKLNEGESFTAPEVVMVYSDQGLGQMSRTYHDLYRNNLCRGNWKNKPRPVVINNWEATYFDFNAEKLFALADTAAKEGMELMVLDDGWFGHRDDDTTSLGDWYVYKDKLPGGIEEISEGIRKRGLKFGLWFEPEMVSPDSDLYRAHPDWVLQIKDRDFCLGRNQRGLDLSRKDVVDYLIEVMDNMLGSGLIDYIKWDFNRTLTEIASTMQSPENQMKVGHLYYLGLYKLMEHVTQKYPDVLFESCSGGGGRFDPALLYYMSQCWTSDNTDALSRVAIQMGTSIVYPASSMSCHVSAVPNHQTGRVTSLNQRGHCAMAGAFGYELDLNKLEEAELAEIKEQVATYKRIRDTVQYGDLYRYECPWNTRAPNETGSFGAWSNVSKDKSQCVFTVIWTYAEAHAEITVIKLRGLDPDATYNVQGPKEFFDNVKISGEELMNVGLYVSPHPHLKGSLQLILEKI